jgi:hypothetical protein
MVIGSDASEDMLSVHFSLLTAWRKKFGGILTRLGCAHIIFFYDEHTTRCLKHQAAPGGRCGMCDGW